MTGEVPTPGEYVLLKERPVRLAVAMIILSTFVWKILRLQYQIPDPKLQTIGMVGRPRMDNDVTQDPHENTSTQSRDLPYTDMYVTEEQQYDTSYDHDCGFTYSLEAQVHSIVASSQAKRYFTTLSLST